LYGLCRRGFWQRLKSLKNAKNRNCSKNRPGSSGYITFECSAKASATKKIKNSGVVARRICCSQEKVDKGVFVFALPINKVHPAEDHFKNTY